MQPTPDSCEHRLDMRYKLLLDGRGTRESKRALCLRILLQQVTGCYNLYTEAQNGKREII